MINDSLERRDSYFRGPTAFWGFLKIPQQNGRDKKEEENTKKKGNQGAKKTKTREKALLFTGKSVKGGEEGSPGHRERKMVSVGGGKTRSLISVEVGRKKETSWEGPGRTPEQNVRGAGVSEKKGRSLPGKNPPGTPTRRTLGGGLNFAGSKRKKRRNREKRKAGQ